MSRSAQPAVATTRLRPRDIVETIVDGALYDNRDPKLDIAALDELCTTYFLKPMNALT